MDSCYIFLVPDKDERDAHDALGTAAKQFVAASRTAIETVLRPYGLGGTQWWVLEQVALEGQLRQRDVAAAHVDRATASEIVLTLVAKGLIVQRTDPADQRPKMLQLTETG